MLGRTYESQNCSAARALELVGERWSLLIFRDALFRGYTRFSEFERGLGIAPNILAARLQRFVAAGLMDLGQGSEGLELPRYVLSDKGRDLAPVIVALTTWGDRWAASGGSPVLFGHDDCRGEARPQIVCAVCGRRITPAELTARPGPGATEPG